jgi:hypothetical protein
MPQYNFQLLLQMWHFSNDEECPPGDGLFKIWRTVDRVMQRLRSAAGKKLCTEETMAPFQAHIFHVFHNK